MHFDTPGENSGQKETKGCHKAGRWLWLLPPVFAALFWFAAELMEDHFPCSDIVPELIAAVLGALFGLFVSNALRDYCKKTKDR